ncbi:hypothetical protein C8J57DRAFT_1244047 [Mycena rebaudengoi]|nr:hypothetical protein C8J57DRAFT_1244047 [Mycena rebaudengoi]
MRIKRYADVPVKIDVVTTSFVVGGAILWAVAAALDGHWGMLSYFALFGVAIEFYARTRGNVAESDHQYRVLVMTAVQRQKAQKEAAKTRWWEERNAGLRLCVNEVESGSSATKYRTCDGKRRGS